MLQKKAETVNAALIKTQYHKEHKKLRKAWKKAGRTDARPGNCAIHKGKIVAFDVSFSKPKRGQ